METYEKDILKREITAEVREELTRSSGKLITRRVLLALCILAMETLLWVFLITSSVQSSTVAQGVLTCLVVVCFRVTQAGMFAWFNEK
ncbi:hypothetical protein [Tichowtungia aerotolerans]|uniref:Uncharacterized protein n=1 Tax=Tichowtungia aerotolerans TaxID=2697043 RepID=A0A6P1M9V4_9BACT|nr:hypothetical protein [Tichowtungia aerotolerans]QHI69853.1 hypothetical protein GT409_10450 [Tichowtungia aerotolerans]